jgi:excisionase family DNA binding protein
MSPTKAAPEGRLLTAYEVAAVLHLDVTTVYRLLRAEKLPGHRVGSDWRINANDLKGMMERTDHIQPKLKKRRKKKR